MQMQKIGKFVRSALGYLVAAICLVIVWFWVTSPPPFAIATKEADGYYVKIDLRDEAFEQVCLKIVHYGWVWGGDGLPCVDCPVSPDTWPLIAGDDGWPLRLAVWRGQYFDVYEIEFADDAAWGVHRYDLSEPARCSKHPISVARCQPDAAGKRCAFEFAGFSEPDGSPR